MSLRQLLYISLLCPLLFCGCDDKKSETSKRLDQTISLSSAIPGFESSEQVMRRAKLRAYYEEKLFNATTETSAAYYRQKIYEIDQAGQRSFDALLRWRPLEKNKYPTD